MIPSIPSPNLTPTRALFDVLAERAKQDARWGVQNHEPAAYLAILVEEVGELAEAILNRDVKLMREEAVQVAAVALAIVECYDRGVWKWNGSSDTQRDAFMLRALVTAFDNTDDDKGESFLTLLNQQRKRFGLEEVSGHVER